jgi:hypothetical protein
VKFRKKPVVIDAVRWYGGNVAELMALVRDAAPETSAQVEVASGLVYVHTLEGTMAAGVGDWIIRGVKGELYPCKPDIFEATYEAVED